MEGSSLGATHWTGYLARNDFQMMENWGILTEGESISGLTSDGSGESGLSGASSDLEVGKEETHL